MIPYIDINLINIPGEVIVDIYPDYNEFWVAISHSYEHAYYPLCGLEVYPFMERCDGCGKRLDWRVVDEA